MRSVVTYLRSLNWRRRPIRVGHAVRTDDASDEFQALRLALAICNGSAKLNARAPKVSSAVSRAETILNANPRPIYAFLGLLHPDLGTVGLIFSRSWTKRSFQGATRCDSGGLVGGFGGFACVASVHPHSLNSISFKKGDDWATKFEDEIGLSYSNASEGYVRGMIPDISSWKDVRVQCIKFAQSTGCTDRRLWTWELRLDAEPFPEEAKCLVLSPEMRKRLDDIYRAGGQIPDKVRILPGGISENGVHWFSNEAVHRAFLGID